jgi:hypothetical protein
MKAKRILAVYGLLLRSKFNKVTDETKMKIFFIMRVLKPHAVELDDSSKQLSEMLRPEGYDEIVARWNEMREKLNLGVNEELPMTKQDFVEFTYRVMKPYNKKVDDALKKLTEKEVELEFEPLTAEEQLQLINSNDWDGSAVDLLDEITAL